MSRSVPAASSAEVGVPRTRRFVWLIRGGIGVAVLLGYLLGLRLWWGHVAGGRMAAAIAAARARRERVTVSDFERHPAVPDSDNAALLLRQAAALVHLSATQSAFDNRYDRYDSSAALSAGEVAILDGIVKDNAAAIALAEQAATLHGCDWGTRFSNPLVSTPMPNLGLQRGLTDLLAYAAVDDHLHGRDAQAVAALDAIFAQADAFDRDRQFLITHLVAIGLNAVGCYRVDAMALSLTAPPPAVRGLIARVLDERVLQQSGVDAWFAERLIAVDFAEHPQSALLWSGVVPRPWLAWPLVPAVQLNALRMFNADTATAGAMGRANYPQARAALPAGARLSPTDASWAYWVTHSLGFSSFPSAAERVLLSQARAVTLRRVAAVLLAIRLYELDHGGADPGALEALVPAYLPRVPVDPFAPDGHALRFVAGPTDREAVYSVGQDGVDDGGSAAVKRVARSGEVWSGRNAVFYVHPEATAASAQGAATQQKLEQTMPV